MSALHCKVTGLKTGQEYEFRIIAENEAGFSKPSAPCPPTLCRDPIDVPDAPGIPRVTDTTSASVSLAWAPPDEDGGAEVLGYFVEKKMEIHDEDYDGEEEEWILCTPKSGVKSCSCTVTYLEVILILLLALSQVSF